MKTLRSLPLVLLLAVTTACHTSRQAADTPDYLSQRVNNDSSTVNDPHHRTKVAEPVTDIVAPSPMVKALDDALRDPLLTSSQLGLCVYDLTDDRPLYVCGGRQRMRPASTMKVVTAIVALDLLGCDYQYKTTLYYSGQINAANGTLRGDLYLRGTFDPLLSTTDVRDLVSALREAGIRRVTGNVYLDTSFKDDLRAGWGWCWDDKNPCLSPITVDGREQMAGTLSDQLRKSGVRLDGKIKSGQLSPNANLLATATHGIEQILRPMLKDSDNRMAESLFYQLAALSGVAGAGRREAAQQSSRLFDRLGITPDHYTVADGSGLSLYNYVTAEMLVTLLRHAASDRRIFDTIVVALPVSGTDGTLRNRMQGTSAEGRVQAKTGTVTGVSSLAGYTTASDGHRIAFAILNQGQSAAGSARRFQDRLCEIMTSNPTK